MESHLLLVWLVIAIWVANLRVDVFLLVDHVVADALGVGVLEVGVEVDLADTVADGVKVVLLAGAGATVEDKEDWLLILGALLLLDVLLVLLEELWPKLDIAWLVDTVHVTETGGDREVWRNWRESLVDVVNVLWLCVERVVVDGLVVDTVLLTTGDTDLHLEPLLHWCSALEVLGGGLDVLLDWLLGKIDHVRGEEWGAGGLELLLISIEHAIEPWEELLCAVVGVEHDRNAVCGCNGADIVCCGDGALDGGRLVLQTQKTVSYPQELCWYLRGRCQCGERASCCACFQQPTAL